MARARIVPAHRDCSASLTRNSPRWPEVPLERPTVLPDTVSWKSRSVSARSAVDIATSRETPMVVNSLKCRIMAHLSVSGKLRHADDGAPAQRSR